MPENFDRRLKARKDWEFKYMGQMPAEMPKVPKEGDKFYILKDGDLGEELTVDSIGYDIKMLREGLPRTVYGVVPYEDDSNTYEIYWNDDRECWISLKEEIQATNA